MNATTVNPTVATDHRLQGRVARRPLTALDRCDACGARAYVRAVMETSDLFFCAHHATRHLDALLSQALVIQDDRHLVSSAGDEE